MVNESNMSNFSYQGSYKNRGLLNAEIQRQKHKEKEVLHPSVKESNNTVSASTETQVEKSDASFNALEVVVKIGQKDVKVTYSMEDIMKKAASVTSSAKADTNTSEDTTNSTVQIELDLNKILEQQAKSATNEITGTEIEASVVSSTNSREESNVKSSSEESAVSPFKLNPVAVALMSGNNLNLNISVKFGNDTIVLGSNSSATIKGQFGEDNAEDVIMVGNNSNINLDSTMVTDNASDILIVGNNSRVNISEENVTDNGNDILIVGNNSEINIKMKNVVDNSDDLVILGNNSRLVLEGENITGGGKDTIIMGNNSELIIKGMSGNCSGGGTIIIGNNKKIVIEGSNSGVSFLDKKNKGEDFKFEATLKMLDEIERLGKNLKKFRVHGKPLKDILDEAIENGKEHIKKLKNLKNKDKNNEKFTDNIHIDIALRLSLYQFFNKQLNSAKLISTFVNEQYKNMKNDKAADGNSLKLKSWAV